MLNETSFALTFTDPIVQAGTLAVAGTAMTRLILRRGAMRTFLGQLLFFLALTVLLLHRDIVPYASGGIGVSRAEQIFLAVAKISWWVNAAWTLVGFVRVFLILEGQPREGRLVQDLVVGLIYVGALLSIVAFVFGAPVGTLIATSGVFAIILGLAMQSTLSDVFSGIALNLGRPYAIGDWIVLGGGIEGRVVETNWRATHLVNGSNDLVVVPNSDLAKARLTNVSRPQRSHGITIAVDVVPTSSPLLVVETMERVLISSNTILADPAPAVRVVSMSGAVLTIELSFNVADAGLGRRAQNEIFDLVYRHAGAAGLKLAPATADPTVASAERRPTPLRLLDTIPLFSSLTEAEKQTLSASMTRRVFHKGDVVVAQDSPSHALMVVRSGVVVATRTEDGRTIELDRLAPGDFFGEIGLLLGESEPATVTASTFVVLYEIGQECLTPLLQDRPAIAEELGATLTRRKDRLHRRFGHGVSVAEPATLVARIRQLFQVADLDGR